jgi:hypothetical protein
VPRSVDPGGEQLSVSMESEAPVTAPRQIPPALVALVAPEAGMERQAKSGGVRVAFLIAFVASALLAFLQSSRLDLRSDTLAKLDADQKLTTMSDKQVDDEVQSAVRLKQVTTVAGGVLAPPLQLLLIALAVVVLAWFFKGKLKGAAVFPIAAASMLPNAIGNLLDAGAVLSHEAITSTTTLAPRTLSLALAALGHPLTDTALKLGNALDFFSLWGAILLGYGISNFEGMTKRRALIGTVVAWVCFRLLMQVAAAGGGH